jgi:hypothetical protein
LNDVPVIDLMGPRRSTPLAATICRRRFGRTRTGATMAHRDVKGIRELPSRIYRRRRIRRGWRGDGGRHQHSDQGRGGSLPGTWRGNSEGVIFIPPHLLVEIVDVMI